ncbi:MAG: fumarylacetoacetate hydrolase family protein [Bacteroidales bacterium]|jgi:2-keto-4-pentenoate hydratase/2-oxohepta-3-ene-1,7-dioic acid hydratase in catechol pathway|nr:fumarylacetoacetate hydrolase family protein [Bacteroidales bacterium]
MKIICIGRNYLQHIKELNHTIPKEPVFFFKCDTALLENNNPFYYPDYSNDVQYECELVVKIDKVGKTIPQRLAKNYYSSIALGLDMTLRDIQEKEIKESLPWSLSKAFDYSAPISEFINIKELGKDIDNINFHLLKNNTIVQKTNTSDMIFSVDYLISYISKYITLKTGDLIFTGTPSGVGKIKEGDLLEGFLEEKKILHCQIK